MSQTTNHSYLSNDQDIAAYMQYARPAQACWYNTPKLRRRLERKLVAKGYDLKQFNGYTVDFDGTLNTELRWGFRKTLTTPPGIKLPG